MDKPKDVSPKKFVMIVDDEPSIVEMLCDVMSLSGYPAKGYNGAKDALKEFLRHPEAYAVVITDLTMPGLKGDELASIVREKNPDCLIIVSTGYHPELLSEKLQNYVLLHKPYQIERLLVMIAEKYT